MHPDNRPVGLAQTTMKEYRDEYRKKQKEFFSSANMTGPRKVLPEILDILQKPRSVDMKQFKGSEEEKWMDIELLYANDGRAFDPTMAYPPNMIDSYGKDYALNARGIYYFTSFRSELVTVGRKVWIPSSQDIDWEDPSEQDRRKQARIISKHNLDNETRRKSEYAWEADAWADVFNHMRDDPCLEIDKHKYNVKRAKTHPVLCTLTKESPVVNRVPDATFGLATFSDSTSGSQVGIDELSKERLEKLLLHRKCGLLCDPAWGETDLVFPFAVYEAKGWSGDCREARRQACEAGAYYLDMLDNLARTPGPVSSTKPYQTRTSHQYQVFALTSFGAHWHLLVGYQRPRQADEHAGIEGMSETVYVFQRVWGAPLTNERAAWELLSLVNQIHLWAITDFRTYVTEHLKPWHKFCDDNYLLDWKSVYDVKPELKQVRTCSGGMNLVLPCWAKLLKDSVQREVYVRAQKSLAKALKEQNLRKGKGRAYEPESWQCSGDDECPTPKELYTTEAFLDHLRDVHHYPENELIQIKQCINEADKTESKEERPERLDDSGVPVSLLNEKNGCKRRVVVEEESLDRGLSDASSVCIAGPSKRVKVA